MASRRATIRDVAALAGVSPGTVSKALNRSGPVSDATRSRIEAAVKQTGFRPNQLARSIFERRSYTVGMITTDSFARFSVPVMLGAEDALGAGQISVFMCDSRGDPIRERHYIDVLQDRRVDGFIVSGRRALDESRRPLAVDPGTPVVYAMTPSEDPQDCSVVADDASAGRIAAEHLIKIGRRHLAHVGGSEDFIAAQERARGCAEAAATCGFPLVAAPFFGGWTEEWGRHATHMALRSHPEIDSIYCGSDQIARGVGDALRDLGRSVPHDVALIGTDNAELFALGARPQLTTVDTRLADVGRRAAQRLLQAINGDAQAGIERVPGRLVIRGSTDPTVAGA